MDITILKENRQKLDSIKEAKFEIISLWEKMACLLFVYNDCTR